MWWHRKWFISLVVRSLSRVYCLWRLIHPAGGEQGGLKADIRSILPSVFNFCVTVFIQFQFHIYIPGWIGGRSDRARHLEETLWQGKLGAKLEFLGQTRLKTLQTLWHLGEVKLAWWCLFPARAESSPGSWWSQSCTDTRGWDTSQTLWSYQVSGDHYMNPGDRVFIVYWLLQLPQM